MKRGGLDIKTGWGLSVALILCLLGVWWAGVSLDQREQGKSEREDAYLISAEQLRPFLSGYDLIAADLFWLETVQYLGRHLLTDQKFPNLNPRLIRVVSLDPHFLDVYRLGGLFLAYSANQVDEAIRLLERGEALNSDRWELPHDLGIMYYLLKKDHPQALRWLEKAEKLPGRPDYVARFVARLYAATGQRETAAEMWIQVYDQTNLKWVKDIARRELKKLGIHLREEAGG